MEREIVVQGTGEARALPEIMASVRVEVTTVRVGMEVGFTIVDGSGTVGVD
jgi:hypothetical protein